MYRDRVHEAREIAAAPTLERMRRDAEKLPPQLSRLMTYLVDHLFDVKLTATRAWKEAGIGDHSLTTAFRAATSMTVRECIERRRLEVADRILLTHDDIDIVRISLEVGFEHHSTFVDAYKRWLGELPSHARRKPKPPEIDYLVWRRGVRGELDADAAWDVHETWLRIYPSVEDRLRQRYGGPVAEPLIEVDGDRHERWYAEGLWQEVRALPLEEQRRRVRQVAFGSTALFDLLRKRSREEGRRDRRRGIELAELALVSLEGGARVFGERIHDLKALGWAWLGNAHVLALDFTAAGAAFEESDDAWRVAREQRDHLALARICNLKGTLRMFQRRYDDALELVARSSAEFGILGDPHGEARALIQSAAIHGYCDRPEQSVATLEKAMALVDAEKDRHLAFAASTNLANVNTRLGRYQAASASLVEARDHCSRLDYPLGWHEIHWVDGDISEGLDDLSAAEALYLQAKAGFGEAKEPCVALLDLDLAVVYSRQEAWDKAIAHASEAVPMLASLSLHEETAAAVRVLSTALRAGNVSQVLLRKVRRCLRQDPLATLSQE